MSNKNVHDITLPNGESITFVVDESSLPELFNKNGRPDESTKLKQLNDDIVENFSAGRYLEAAKSAATATDMAINAPIFNYFADYAQRQYGIAVKAYGEHHVEVARALLIMSRAFMDLNYSEHAFVPLMQRAMSIANATSGISNALRSNIHNEMARAMRVDNSAGFVTGRANRYADPAIVDHYRKAIELTSDPKDEAVIRCNLGNYLIDLMMKKEAELELKAAAALARRHGADFVELQAMSYLNRIVDRTRLKECIQIKRRCIELFDKGGDYHPGHLGALAALLLEDSQADEANVMLKDALSKCTRNSDRIRILENMAEAANHAGRSEFAADYLRQADAIRPRPVLTPDKVPCTTCGRAILHATAQSNGGLCMPCKRAFDGGKKPP